MARITVEDCLKKVNNRFTLIHMAAKRVRQLRKGAEPTVLAKNKDIVVSLREIAAGNVYMADPEQSVPLIEPQDELLIGEPAQSGEEALEAAGQPVIRIAVRDIYDVGQEMFRWEIATAVAGSLMDVNPFNQPDVEASKVATRALTDAFVDAQNLTGALRLYKKAGMHISRQTDEFEKEIRPGRDISVQALE